MGKKKKIIAPVGDIVIVEDNGEVKEAVEVSVPVVEEKPEVKEVPTFKYGDIVRLTPDATYASGAQIPDAFFAMKLYVKGYSEKGNVQIAQSRRQSYFGLVPPEMLEIVPEEELAAATVPVPEIEPYLVKVVANDAPVKAGASPKYKTVATYNSNSVYTIIAERNGYGKLKNGKGWISFQDVARLKV